MWIHSVIYDWTDGDVEFIFIMQCTLEFSYWSHGFYDYNLIYNYMVIYGDVHKDICNGKFSIPDWCEGCVGFKSYDDHLTFIYL